MTPKQNLQEFEHEMDVLNVVFGAALGGYVGIILATETLTSFELWMLVLLLASIGGFLLAVRELARAVLGLPYAGVPFPWSISYVLLTAFGVQLIALLIPVAGDKFSVIFRGWVGTLALYLLLAHIRKRKWK